jgi:hypothetical protein
MTRDTYDKATVALDKTLQLQAVRDKIKRELPELMHDKRLRERIGEDLYIFLETKIALADNEFGKL